MSKSLRWWLVCLLSSWSLVGCGLFLDLDEELAEEEEEEPTLAAPVNLVASTDDVSAVLLTWEAVERATAYEVWRGDTRLEVVEGTTFADNDADAPGAPGLLDVEVSRGDVDGIQVDWSGGENPGTSYEYRVRAVRDEEVGAFSAMVFGHRASYPLSEG